MPRQKVPISLQEQCKAFLTWEIVAVETASELKVFEYRLSHVVNSLSSSRVAILIKLIATTLEAVMDSLCINPHNIRILLMSNRNALRLPYFFRDCWANKETEMVKLIVQKCLSVTYLDLTGCRISIENFKHLINSFRFLQTLTLNNTTCPDSVFEYILKTCKKLLALHMENNQNITDRAFQDFKPPYQIPSCRKLMILDVPNADWSVNTIVTILTCFPSLEQLCHPLLMKGLETLISRQMIGVIPPLTNILAMDYKDNSGDSLNQILKYCREISELKLLGGVKTLQMIHLPLLSHLKNLSELIYIDDISSLTESIEEIPQDNGVLMKVLLECGKNLTFLSITGSHQLIDIRELNDLCPNLKYVCLYTTTLSYMNNGSLNKGLFPNVIFLHIILNQFKGLPEYSENLKGAFKVLLESCLNLQTLILMDIPFLTDEVLRSIFRTNSMSELEKLDIYQCSGLTIDGVCKFLEMKNKLVSMQVRECDKIGKKQIIKLEKIIQSNNFDIDTLFC